MQQQLRMEMNECENHQEEMTQWLGNTIIREKVETKMAVSSALNLGFLAESENFTLNDSDKSRWKCPASN